MPHNKKTITEDPFSKQLSVWLSKPGAKTLADLVDHFGEKSFAVLFLLLMALPALPIPTGGVTHVFEIICMLVALEMIAGLRTVWLPKKWGAKPLPKSLQTTALPKLIALLQKVERFSRRRLRGVLQNTLVIRLIGLFVFALCVFAFIAPPYTGLDTLPALGIVTISLALILEDIVLSVIGVVLGAVGAGLVIALGGAALKLLFH